MLEDEKLGRRGFRKIHFGKYKYKLVFHMKGNTAIIDNLFHDKQDYENILG